MRVRPKGGGKGAHKKKLPLQRAPGDKWDPNGYARCGRSSHWAKECDAKLDVNGNPPREKPKGKSKGKGKQEFV